MSSSQWIDAFVGHVSWTSSGQSGETRGWVVLVESESLLFQTFECIPKDASLKKVSWGEFEVDSIFKFEQIRQSVFDTQVYKLICSRPLPTELRYASRKNEQLACALLYDHEDRLSSVLESVQLPYPTVWSPPQLASDALSCEFLGKSIACPFYIAGMTGGSAESDRVNRVLADVASEIGIPLALGSQRRVLEGVGDTDLRHHFSGPLIGNIGIAEITRFGPMALKAIHERTGVDAIAIHLNILQELVQKEGSNIFEDTEHCLRKAISDSPVPVILKETGCGFHPAFFESCMAWPVYALELSAQSGTNWMQLEGLRSASVWEKQLAEDFSEIGWSSESQLRLVTQFRDTSKRPKLVASGGISRGIHVTKWLYAGADFCSVGRGVLRVLYAHNCEVQPVVDYLNYLKKSLTLGLQLTEKTSIHEFIGSWSP